MREKGHYDATVEPQIIRLPENRVNVVFEINDGPSTLISRITFVGNHAYGESRLSEVINSREERWWAFLSTADQYSAQRLDLDKELLRALLPQARLRRFRDRFGPRRAGAGPQGVLPDLRPARGGALPGGQGHHPLLAQGNHPGRPGGRAADGPGRLVRRRRGAAHRRPDGGIRPQPRLCLRPGDAALSPATRRRARSRWSST